MTSIPTTIPGAYLINFSSFADDRGVFQKVFSSDFQIAEHPKFKLEESYYSISHERVIRGMHFQHPPHDHAKLVFSTYGAIVDVVLDIRKNSPTYGQYVSAELSAENNTAIYIPKGFAHGFKTLTDQATTFYFVSSENYRGADDGILYSSVGFDWNVPNPIVSDRDYSFKPFSEFISPF